MPSLKEHLEAGRCVAFVGAGFSMPCGMPNWSGLLHGMLEDARKDSFDAENDLHFRSCEWFLNHNSLSMAASILREIVSEGEIRTSIHKRFSLSILEQSAPKIRARMKARMRNLVTAPWAGLITTNYDSLVEHALSTYGKEFSASYVAGEPSIGSLLASSSQGTFLAKLHGSSEGGNIVLSTEEYDRAYLMKPQISGFLSAVMLKYHLVFIGCSLEDEICRIRRRLFGDYGHQLPLAYALLPMSEENAARRAWMRKWVGIESILYRADTLHSAVDRFLRLVGQTEPNIDVGGVDSISELRRLKTSDRIERIGQVNRELIRMIRKRSRKEISHLDLVNPGKVDPVDTVLGTMSPEERVYRMLYLVSVGLVRESQDNEGRRSYRLSRAIALK
jgi:hypothetical protein